MVSVNIKLQKYYLNTNPHVLRVHLITEIVKKLLFIIIIYSF